MSNSTRVQWASATLPATQPAVWLRNIGIVLAGSAFVAVCSHISLPLGFTPVPLTLQPFAVLVLGLFLSPRLAATTLVAYLGEAAAGLPVLTPGLPGLAHLLGPTGGYLFAYPLAALLISALFRGGNRSFARAAVSAAAGNLLILTLGALWLAAFTHVSVLAAVSSSLVPFLPGDALKVISAAALAAGWQRLRLRNAASHPTV